ncbi:MAG: barstar family protein [Nitrospirae bacterium]|nr:barstar family protein [Nitrospirota bacterium]
MTPKLTLPAYLQSTKAPWSSLLIVKAGQRAESLIHVPDGYKLKIIKGAKCQTTAGLLTEFARALDFPDYFGHNWDALEECLADLEWLPAKGYILLLTDAAQVLPDDEDEYETFLEVLSDAGEAWGSGQAGMGARRATPFHVLFAISEREKSKRARWELSEISTEPSAPRKASSRRA